MVETLVIVGVVITAVIAWWRRKSPQRRYSRGQSSMAYTRPPSLGRHTPQDGGSELPTECTISAERARQEAFDSFERFRPGADPKILADAAKQFRRASDLAARGDPQKSRDLVHVATVLRVFYDETTELWALNDAVTAAQAALTTDPDPDTRHDAQVRLGICLYTKFKATREKSALAQSLDALRAAAATAALTRPQSLASLYHLAVALHLAHDDTRDSPLLQEAVAVGRQAAMNPNPLQVPALCQVVRHLRELSRVVEDAELLREAESVARWGVEITADANPEDRSSCLFELARTLETVGLRTGRSDYLREAVSTVDQAILCTPDMIEKRLRNVIATGMVQNLHKKQQSGGESADETSERLAGTHDDSPPPPPPLDFTG